MDQAIRNLGHTKAPRFTFMNRIPSISELSEGDHVEAFDNGILKLYTKRNGSRWSLTFTKDS